MNPLRYILCYGLLTAGAAFSAPVQISTVPAKVVPEQVTTLPLERGIVSDLADASVRHERGAILAVLNREQMQQEKEELELKMARDRLSLKDELRKLEQQRHKVQFYLNLSESERRYAATEHTQLTPDTLSELDERISLLKREMENMERHRTNELARKQARNTLRMPFSGRIQYHFTLPENRSEPFEYTSPGAVPFATICDDSAFYITISLSRAELTQLPEQNFSVEISLPEGKVLRGTYSHRRVEQNGNSDMLVYFFRLPESDHDRAMSMLGSQAKAKLYYNAGEHTMMLQKAELARHPRAAQCRNWEELIEALYPEYNLVIIGEREIIISRKES